MTRSLHWRRVPLLFCLLFGSFLFLQFASVALRPVSCIRLIGRWSTFASKGRGAPHALYHLIGRKLRYIELELYKVWNTFSSQTCGTWAVHNLRLTLRHSCHKLSELELCTVLDSPLKNTDSQNLSSLETWTRHLLGETRVRQYRKTT